MNKEDDLGSAEGADVDDGNTLTMAIKQKEAIQALIRSEGWTILNKIITTLVRTESEAIILHPLGEKYKDPYAQEWAKGNVHGLRTIQLLVTNIVAEAEAIVEHMTNANRDPDTGRDPGGEFDRN